MEGHGGLPLRGMPGGNGVRLQGESLPGPPPSTLPNKWPPWPPQSKKSLSFSYCLSLSLSLYLPPSLPLSLPPVCSRSLDLSWSFLCLHMCVYIYMYISLSFFFPPKPDPNSTRPPPPTLHPPPFHAPPLLSMNHHFFPLWVPFQRPAPLPCGWGFKHGRGDIDHHGPLSHFCCVFGLFCGCFGRHRATISRLNPCNGLEQDRWELPHSSGCETRQDKASQLHDKS